MSHVGLCMAMYIFTGNTQKIFNDDSQQKQIEASDKVKEAIEKTKLHELVKRLKQIDITNQ